MTQPLQVNSLGAQHQRVQPARRGRSTAPALKQRQGRTAALSVAGVLVGATFALATQTPLANAAPSKVTVGGQDITGNSGGAPVCDLQGSPPAYHIQGHDGLYTAVLSNDRTQVQMIDVMQVSLGKEWSWSPGSPGNAQVSQSGNTYTIKGSVAPSRGGSPVPFEVDATCP